MEINVEELTKEIMDAIKKEVEDLDILNIIVSGKTGVGKSVLINSVFRDNLAKTGVGKPVTQHMTKLTKKGVPLAIYDTRGFELGGQVQCDVKKEIIDAINTGLSSQDINEAIHCIWYCINTASNRIEKEEIEWIKELANDTQVPIIVILTQAFQKKNAQKMKEAIEAENMKIIDVIPVLAEAYIIEDLGTIPAYGLDTLIRIMRENMPEEVQNTLQNVQKVSLEEKKRRAQKVVRNTVLAVAAEGAAPIPFSDCALMIPTQAKMIASITAIFGVNVKENFIKIILSSSIGIGSATILGKTVVSNILKFIPGLGTVAGSTISAGTGGLITSALGNAYIGIMERIYKGEMTVDDIGTSQGKEVMKQLFISYLKNGKSE